MWGVQAERLSAARDPELPGGRALICLVSAVYCEEFEGQSSRRYMDSPAIKGPWKREAAPIPDPSEWQLSMARQKIVALSGSNAGI